MKINISQVRRMTGETARYDLKEEFSPFEFGMETISFLSPLHVQLQVHNTGKLLIAHGTIEAELKAVCGRCLEEFSYPLHLDFEDEWVYASQATEEQQENALIFDKDEIELRERIMEHIVLALPMKFVCSPDCQGLCPECGANLNLGVCSCSKETLDPRLAELAKLAKLTLDD
ncbi:MAG: DUF177 domain-containing protein [Desulfitobacteriaceae bacterium]|nr:DUF177 domain-containing protein [Desulfitobacteriaceae bacterium]